MFAGIIILLIVLIICVCIVACVYLYVCSDKKLGIFEIPQYYKRIHELEKMIEELKK